MDTGLPASDRDQEEMEILRRYIRRENPGAEYICNCAKSTVDFNCHFVFDSKVTAHKLGRGGVLGQGEGSG